MRWTVHAMFDMGRKMEDSFLYVAKFDEGR
jgi:hypothetical protein